MTKSGFFVHLDFETISKKTVTKVIKQITRKKLKSGKIKKIIKVIKVKSKPEGGSRRVRGRRRVRCGKCEGCLVEKDCGKCIYCRYDDDILIFISFRAF